MSGPDRDGERERGDDPAAAVERTPRWRAAVAAVFVLAGLGLGANRPTLVLAGAVPLAYVAYGTLDRVPTVADAGLAVEREVAPTPAPPGRLVRVTLTVRNEGARRLRDVRVIDRVPDALVVDEGSPRGAATLAPGETVTVEYGVTARRGDHAFAPPRVRLYGPAGAAVATGSVTVAGDRRLNCRLDAGAPPLDDPVGRRGGAMTADEPGPGVEFHSVREYRHGDPASRVDWRHYAKRGELATVDYRERRAARVVLVVDAREPCHVVAAAGRPSAAELCAYGAVRALDDLVGAGHEVGVAVLGRAADEGELPWLDPGGGREHRASALALCRRAAEGSAEVDHDRQVRAVADRAPPDAQILLFSPLLDDPPVGAVATWRARGRSCGVLAPDVLAASTVSGQHAATHRALRLAGVQGTGARAVDWRRGTPLPAVLDRAVATAGSSRAAGGATERPGGRR